MLPSHPVGATSHLRQGYGRQARSRYDGSVGGGTPAKEGYLLPFVKVVQKGFNEECRDNYDGLVTAHDLCGGRPR
jgi:hypothetical protein